MSKLSAGSTEGNFPPLLFPKSKFENALRTPLIRTPRFFSLVTSPFHQTVAATNTPTVAVPTCVVMFKTVTTVLESGEGAGLGEAKCSMCSRRLCSRSQQSRLLTRNVPI